MRNIKQTTTVVLLTLLLVASLPAAFAGPAMAEPVPEESVDSLAGADPVDEIYINDDGDAVLLHEQTAPDETSAEYGLDASQELLYALVSADDATDDDDVTANLLVDLEPDSLTGEADATVPSTDEIDDLELSVEGEQSDESAEADGELTASVSQESQTLGKATDTPQFELATITDESNESELELSTDSLFEPSIEDPENEVAQTSGDVTVNSDEFRSEASFSIADETAQDADFNVDLSGQNGEYDLDVGGTLQVPEEEAGIVQDETALEQALEEAIEPTAEELGGSATVTVNTADATPQPNGLYEVELDVSVTVSGVEDGLTDEIATELVEDPTVDLTQTEADEIAADIVAIDIQSLAVEFESDETGELSGSWDIDIQNLEPATESMFDVAESAVDETDEELLDSRDRFDAATESSYEQQFEWEAEISESQMRQIATIDMEASYETANRAAYTDALADRGIETGADVEYELTVEQVGDDIELDATYSASDDALLENALDSAISEIRDDPTADSESTALLEAIRDGDLDRAKLDVSLEDRAIEVETGATFDDISEVQALLGESLESGELSEFYGETEGDSEVTYVTVESMVDSDASESDVSQLEVVDSSTEIHMPGEWDEEFPTLDVDRAGEFLGVDFDEDKSDDDSPDDDESDEQVEQPVEEYADEETGVVETDGLRDAIDDWRNDDDVETDTLRDVIAAWRSGEAV